MNPKFIKFHNKVMETWKYRKLSPRDILRWGDEYKTKSGNWLKVYHAAVGSLHTVGLHPSRGFEYRRPVKVG